MSQSPLPPHIRFQHHTLMYAATMSRRLASQAADADPVLPLRAENAPPSRSRASTKVADFLKIRTDFATRLRDRGYPGGWLRAVCEEIQYKVERPKALISAKAKTSDDDRELHVLKLTHNPTWEEIDLQPCWRELDGAWDELGAGYPKFRFLASFKKPASLGDRLNTVNRDTLEDYHRRLAENV
ncbi:hypothetical protein B0H11DRAFT_2262007 [Mycena galericulata]|nr:hypothetical protein B0H11DRAFT_2262007 [Mycena galericulata]